MAKTALPLPVRLEEVDAAWLAAATGCNVSTARVVDVILGTSTKIRVAVESDSLPPTLIVKGGFEDHSPKMREMYRNEIDFYSRIAPHLPINTPRCWYAGSDPGSHQSIVIMEDLVASGVTFLHAQRPETRAAVEKRLAALARFHAASWYDPKVTPQGRGWDWVPRRFTDWSMVYAERYLSEEVWRHYCESPRGAATSVRLHDRDWMRRALSAYNTIEANDAQCVIHGDTHLGNLYVEADGTPGFLDSQPSVASPFNEVAYHITGALDIADRAGWERELLDFYLDALAQKGIRHDRELAWLRYRQYIGYGFFIFLINEIRFQTEAINTAYTARFGAAMLDHDVMNLVG